MKLAVLSDIHGNLEALQAVAGELEGLAIKDLVCLGDVVGYGANPRECLDFITERSTATVAGNHDLAAVCEGAADFFNQAAREACTWTSQQLRATDRAFLSSLRMKIELEDLRVQLVHADSTVPKLFDYMQDCVEGQRSLAAVPEGYICLVGHTHVPVYFQEEGPFYGDGQEIRLLPGARVIVNVGSVGQPRDGDRRASFGVFDSDARTIEIRRIAYDYEEAARKIREEGLPYVLGERLKFGR